MATVLTCVGLAIAVLAASATSQTPGAGGTPMTAMVVGDSISQGSAGDLTWRYRLDKALTAAGVAVTFEGPYTDLFDNVAGIRDGNHAYADPSFDQHHDALWGSTLQAAAALVREDAATTAGYSGRVRTSPCVGSR